jgi:hypothetical protein
MRIKLLVLNSLLFFFATIGLLALLLLVFPGEFYVAWTHDEKMIQVDDSVIEFNRPINAVSSLRKKNVDENDE